MWEIIRGSGNRTKSAATRIASRQGRRPVYRLYPEFLEDRTLMAASLQPIANLTVPALQGYTLPLDGSGTSDAQTFTVKSSNPDIAVTIPQPEFWTVGVSYTDPVTASNSFTGSLTFELFPSLTPQTDAQIVTLSSSATATNFVNTFKYFNRIVGGFPTASDVVVQGGSPTANGQNTPTYTTIPNEQVQQLAFTGTDQLAMANSGGTNSGSTQFFITTGSPNSELGYNYTVFGQLVSGQATLAKMTHIPLMNNPLYGEDSEPVNPLTITSTTITNSNPNGVAPIDTTQAKPGETSTITVNAFDTVDHKIMSQSFLVTVGPYGGPLYPNNYDPNLNFRPFASPVTASITANTSRTIQLIGANGYPDPSFPSTLSYSVVSPPASGAISNFNSSTGTFTYTPAPGFTGTDKFRFIVQATGPASTPATTTSNVQTITITVTARPPPPLVTVAGVQVVENNKQQVTQVIVIFSGPLDPTSAQNKTVYRLATPGSHGSYKAKNAGIIAIRKAVYSGSGDSVTLSPTSPFSLKKAVQLLIRGKAPSGLKDGLERYIDGAAKGKAGSDAIEILAAPEGNA